jgi:hypothetical protein
MESLMGEKKSGRDGSRRAEKRKGPFETPFYRPFQIQGSGNSGQSQSRFIRLQLTPNQMEVPHVNACVPADADKPRAVRSETLNRRRIKIRVLENGHFTAGDVIEQPDTGLAWYGH